MRRTLLIFYGHKQPGVRTKSSGIEITKPEYRRARDDVTETFNMEL